jgi:hypothetical protein
LLPGILPGEARRVRGRGAVEVEKRIFERGGSVREHGRTVEQAKGGAHVGRRCQVEQAKGGA